MCSSGIICLSYPSIIKLITKTMEDLISEEWEAIMYHVNYDIETIDNNMTWIELDMQREVSISALLKLNKAIKKHENNR